MQQATAIIVNDIGLLKVEQIPQFRSYLESKGVEVRDAGAGQFCHVRMPTTVRWLPIERGRGGVPVTPSALRGLVDEFLLCGGVNETNQSFQVLPLGVVPAPPAAQINPAQGAQTSPAPLSRYLSDLRDDFALHAPLLWSDELSALENANRRWQYADVMLAARTTQAGD